LEDRRNIGESNCNSGDGTDDDDDDDDDEDDSMNCAQCIELWVTLKAVNFLTT